MVEFLLGCIVFLLLWISWQLDKIAGPIHRQIVLLRREVAAGLGVNIDDPNGYLDGGHLEELRDDVRERRKRDRSERLERERF